jgi:hypothetical protein
MSAFLGEMDDDNEFMLSKKNANIFQTFVMSATFIPFMDALDANSDRAALRKKQAEDINEFKAFRRDRGARELHRWLQTPDNPVEYDEDNYTALEFAKTPERYPEWLELIDVSTRLNDDQGMAEIISKALLNLMNYAHNMHFKLDYLLANARTLPESVSGGDPFEDFVLKYPWLSRCDDHVAKLKSSNPVQLSRTSTVSGCVSFCSLPAFISCSFLAYRTVFLVHFHILCCIS